MASAKKLIAGIREVLNLVGTALPDQNVADAIDLLDHNEWGEALSLICTQLFEYDIRISDATYSRIARLAEEMKLPKGEWAFVDTLVTKTDGNREA